MPFIDDLRNKQIGSKRTATSAQKAVAKALPPQKIIIMSEVLTRSGLAGMSAAQQYENLDVLLNARDLVSADIVAAGLSEDDSVIGGVSLLIFKIGL